MRGRNCEQSAPDLRARVTEFLAAFTMPAATRTASAATPDAASGAPGRVLPAAASGRTVGSEIHDGPGWSPSNGRCHPGRKRDACPLVSGEPCLSAPGHGPQGTEAAIQDGRCVWERLPGADYVSITGLAFDHRAKQSGTHYHDLDRVTSGSSLRAYALEEERCTGGAAPTGTGGAKSVHGAAGNEMFSFANVMTIRDRILEGGRYDQWTAQAALITEIRSVIADAFIVTHAPIGMVLKFPGFVWHSSVVASDRKVETVGIETFARSIFPDRTVSNTAMFGFSHAVAHDLANAAWSERSSHDVTDARVGDAGTGPSTWRVSMPATVDRLPGTIGGAAPAGR